MLHQLVVRRRQGRVLPAVLGLVNSGLLVFDPHTHGKGLWLHGYPGFVQHFKGVPGAVADGQNGGIAGDEFPISGFHTHQSAFLQTQSGDLGVEADLSPQGNNSLAQVLHHRQQHVGAHMGLCVVEDVLPGPCFHELLQDPADPGVADAGVQLAVGEGPRAALTELDIAPGVQNAGLEEFLHLLMPGSRVLSPFQHQGLPARHGQNQGREHPRRAEADDHRPFFRAESGLRRPVPVRRRHGCPFAAAFPENFLFAAFYGNVNGIDDSDVRLLPGVHTAPDNGQAPDPGIGDPKQPGSLELKLMGVVFRRHGNIPQSYHVSFLPAFAPASLPELQAHCRL